MAYIGLFRFIGYKIKHFRSLISKTIFFSKNVNFVSYGTKTLNFFKKISISYPKIRNPS
jgi:hypothetical protein